MAGAEAQEGPGRPVGSKPDPALVLRVLTMPTVAMVPKIPFVPLVLTPGSHVLGTTCGGAAAQEGPGRPVGSQPDSQPARIPRPLRYLGLHWS